jgi:hypothetical protein
MVCYIGARNFDLVVTLKGGTAYDAREYTFASIDRSEYNPLHDFIEARNLKIIENAVNYHLPSYPPYFFHFI